MTGDARSVTAGREEASGAGIPQEVPANGRPPKRLIIAVDFGTTYSAVSYVVIDDENDPTQYLSLDKIVSVENYPDDWTFRGGDGDRMRNEVPTEVIYPCDGGFRQRENMVGPAADNDDDEDDDSLNAEIWDLPPPSPPRQQLPPREPAGGRRELREVEQDGRTTTGFGGNDGEKLPPTPSFWDDEDEMMVDGGDGEWDVGGAMGDEDEAKPFRWGYGVHEAWGLAATHSDPDNLALSRFKLLLDNSPTTGAVRARLQATTDELKRRGVIDDAQDVIVDFLTCLLRHANMELRAAGLGGASAAQYYRREMVMCVPAIWTQKACRDMQVAMAKALQRAGFDGVEVQNDSVENLFIVSEPEAAAAYVLATERHISPGDTFVILDAGGGTVDANTYTVSATSPLRLTREVVPPGGGLYGSSYLNEGFQNMLMDLLQDELYLENGENTINGHIEKIMINDFEHRLKRSFDCSTARGFKQYEIPGLRDNPQKRFKRGCLHVSMDGIKGIFLRCLKGIGALMEDQIIAAMIQGTRVDKVLLIGGFAASISLRNYLKRRLDIFCRSRNCEISLIRPENSATAVASGAVLRAFNKERGPRRFARSSYGILRREPRGDFPEHQGVKAETDPHDGLPYIIDTVDWVMKLGREVPPVWTSEPFLCSHTFDCEPVEDLLCEEVLYVSDTATESHYQLKHEKNAGKLLWIGAERVGEIIVDFTFLRDKGLLQPIKNYGRNARGRRIGKWHYRVNYTLVIEVVDRDLQCLAFYDGEIKQRCKINIASAFGPGVK